MAATKPCLKGDSEPGCCLKSRARQHQTLVNMEYWYMYTQTNSDGNRTHVSTSFSMEDKLTSDAPLASLFHISCSLSDDLICLWHLSVSNC